MEPQHMDAFIQVAPQLAIAAFMFYVFRWIVRHFDPHISRLLDSIDDIRETGQRMADIGDRLVSIVETQQEWQEQLDAVLTERHKRVMERLDIQDNTMTQILFAMQECPARKKIKDE
jgi:hypothetical protein